MSEQASQELKIEVKQEQAPQAEQAPKIEATKGKKFELIKEELEKAGWQKGQPIPKALAKELAKKYNVSEGLVYYVKKRLEGREREKELKFEVAPKPKEIVEEELKEEVEEEVERPTLQLTAEDWKKLYQLANSIAKDAIKKEIFSESEIDILAKLDAFAFGNIQVEELGAITIKQVHLIIVVIALHAFLILPKVLEIVFGKKEEKKEGQ